MSVTIINGITSSVTGRSTGLVLVVTRIVCSLFTNNEHCYGFKINNLFNRAETFISGNDIILNVQ